MALMFLVSGGAGLGAHRFGGDPRSNQGADDCESKKRDRSDAVLFVCIFGGNTMGGRGSKSGGGGRTSLSKSKAYKEAYSDEINNSNYRYLSFEASVNSTTDRAMQKQIMGTEMRMHEDVKGEPALKTMQDELSQIKRSIWENHQLAKSYGLSRETEAGIRDALKEHQRRIESVISQMHESSGELKKQRNQLARNKGRNWI